MKTTGSLIRIAALLMALAVVLGALGAHTLKSKLSPDALMSFETGVRYHLLHGLAILALAALSPYLDPKRMRLIAALFLSGILFFSFSIYLLATREISGLGDGIKFLGPVTPFGGLLMIAAWIVLAFSISKKQA
jgi:uncharacterized membrane protein YgdD (TMEM256/DUF423 family)